MEAICDDIRQQFHMVVYGCQFAEFVCVRNDLMASPCALHLRSRLAALAPTIPIGQSVPLPER
eukprot:1419532-Pyramimonas_sp.AAC.1